MDKDKKSYDNSYKSQYPSSYKLDYKSQYPSYGKDDKRDKSKDSKVDIKKIKCINTNLNINGNNAGNVSLGNKGSADKGYLGTYSSDDNGGYGSSEGYSNQGKDFTCIINNNNNNTNVVAGAGGGNATDECPEADEIESCFRQFLLDALFPNFVDALESEAGITVEINGQEVKLRSFADICEALEGLTTFDDLLEAVATILSTAGISVGSDVVTDIAECIEPALAL